MLRFRLIRGLRDWLIIRMAGNSPIAINIVIEGRLSILPGQKYGRFHNCTIRGAAPGAD